MGNTKLSNSLDDIFSNKDNLLLLFKEIGVNSRFVIDKIWENAKFFTTLTTAILSFSIIAITSVIKDMPQEYYHPLIRILLALFPIILITISIIGIKNLIREYGHFLNWLVVHQKLIELLGMDKVSSFKCYQDDKYLLPEIFINKQYKSSKEFIKSAITKTNNLLFYFKLLHYCYIIIGIFILILIIFYEPICTNP